MRLAATGLASHVHHGVVVRNSSTAVHAVHQDGTDHIAPDESIQIPEAGIL
jgi:hypothetical protein